MSELVKSDPQALQPTSPTNMLQTVMMALTRPGMPASELRELLVFGKELEAEQARKDYIVAFQKAKEEMDAFSISKNGLINYGTGKGTVSFAKYEEISEAVKPVLRKYDLTASYSYEYIVTPPKTICVMTLLHKSGHSEQFRSIPMPMVDTSGGKNDLQGAGSVGKYGRRYVVVPAFDILTHDDPDNDGSGKGVAQSLTEEQVETIDNILRACEDKLPGFTVKFKKWMLAEMKTDDPQRLFQGDQLKIVMQKLAAKQKELRLL